VDLRMLSTSDRLASSLFQCKDGVEKVGKLCRAILGVVRSVSLLLDNG
jgi:hypothetical protein